MRSLTAVGLLTLLFYHRIGLSIAVLLFEQSYKLATPVIAHDEWKVVKLPISLPYTSDWINPDGQEGLIQDGDNFYNVVYQRYAIGTLYTLLKTNQHAKAYFANLSEQLQPDDTTAGPAKNPLSHPLKLLKDRIMTFLLPSSYALSNSYLADALNFIRYGELPLPVYKTLVAYHSPPPEN